MSAMMSRLVALAVVVGLAFAVQPALAQSEDSPAALTSKFRAQNGLGPVTSDAKLTSIAQDQANEMAAKDTLDHDVLGPFNRRIAPSGAESAAENIAYGYDNFPKTLDQWINSSGHRKNLLLKAGTRIGVAHARNAASKKTYWAMVIGGGYKSDAPKVASSKDASAKTAAKGTTPAKDKPAARKSDCRISVLGLCL